ncbi:MAG: MaoC family dehydratase [Fimbriimonadales bacterium]
MSCANNLKYFEDLGVGVEYQSGSATISKEEIIEFAERFDPQPFHLDEECAKASIFGQLVASGWHTAALAMRLRVTGPLRLAGGWVGLGVESLKWPRPVLPGDTLSGMTEVLDKRESKSKPSLGIIRLRTRLFNQRGEQVFEVTSTQMVSRRPST